MWAIDMPKTCFRTRYGNYIFLVMTFDIINALASFMSMKNKFFNLYIDLFVIVIIDYILIYSKSTKEHDEHLRIVLGCYGRKGFMRNSPSVSFGFIKCPS